LLQETARFAPQVLAGQGVAQWPFVAAPAARRDGGRPKSRRNCLCRKELEKVSRIGAVEQEFRPPQKSFCEDAKERVCL